MVMLCTKLDPAKLQGTAPNSPANSGCGPEVLPLPLAEEMTSILHPKNPAWVQEGFPGPFIPSFRKAPALWQCKP